MLFIVCRSLVVACCVLRCCLLRVVYGLLFVVCCSLFAVVVGCWLLFVAGCIWFNACCVLCVVHSIFVVACCLLVVACSLFVVGWRLSGVMCSAFGVLVFVVWCFVVVAPRALWYAFVVC